MKSLTKYSLLLSFVLLSSCLKENPQMKKDEDKFTYQTEQFADLAILRYKVPGFEELTLKQKELVYYLYEAALAGRDIFYDQNFKYNLEIRKTLEAVAGSYGGDRKSEEFNKFIVYAKRVWFSNGIHHHYSNKKFQPDFSEEYFAELVKGSDAKMLPLAEGENAESFLKRITPIIFDPNITPMKVSQDSKNDIVKNSAVNFYEGVTQKEVEAFYNKMQDKNDPRPVWYGLNSKVVKENGKPAEKTWKIGGMYSPAIEKIVSWLEKAVTVSENDVQKAILQKLIEYYKTGDLKTWDEYNKMWVRDTLSRVDVVNGFIEVYNDPLGYKGSFESIVSIKDLEATKRIDAISRQAQWFEDNSPIDDKFKKKNVVGISAKVITVVVESGESSPSTPIGINLPNSNWIRKEYGSKSVSLGNINESYDKAASEKLLKEFSYTDEEYELIKKYGTITDNLHTDLHEVIGHASGQINPGVGTPKQSLKNYASTIEEARADLVALYYIADKKLIDIGVIPNDEAFKTEYNRYIRNGLLQQLARVKPGENIEQAHMRNRQLIAKWCYEKGNTGSGTGVIEMKKKDGKTYVVITDYQKLRTLFGQLLKEMQRITSEGDYESAKMIVEKYGVIVDKDLQKEVIERYKKLNVAPYKGFINPVLKPVYENGKITDVKIEYPEDFTEQMLFYAKNYSFLPNRN
ncbi:MAG: dipeptidyl-peptidase 3 family protein [Ignavibacteria bacterium]